MNGPSRSEIAENWTGPDYQDEGTKKCDRCEEMFDGDDITRHEDGNDYCPDCNYETEEDRRDGEADRLRDELENR